MISAVSHVAAMAGYALADLGQPGAISLAQNESAFPASPNAIAAGQAALADAYLYPDPDWRDLRDAIASVHGIDADHILCGAGSMELIGCLIRAFAGAGEEVIGTAHGYLFVASAAAQAQANYVTVPEPDFTVSIDAVLTAVTDRTRIVFLCNPGNPTGTRIPNADILRIREALPDRVLLAVDQAYGEFDDQDPAPAFDLVARSDTVVLRTLSKAYALAGARVGWGLFPNSIAKEMRKLLNPNNISTVAQAMATAAIHDQAHMRDVVARTSAIRDRFASQLRMAGFRVPDSHTNFVMIGFRDADEAMRANQRLRMAGLILRGLGGYSLPHCLRATIGPGAIMDRLAETLIAFRGARHGD